MSTWHVEPHLSVAWNTESILKTFSPVYFIFSEKNVCYFENLKVICAFRKQLTKQFPTGSHFDPQCAQMPEASCILCHVRADSTIWSFSITPYQMSLYDYSEHGYVWQNIAFLLALLSTLNIICSRHIKTDKLRLGLKCLLYSVFIPVTLLFTFSLSFTLFLTCSSLLIPSLCLRCPERAVGDQWGMRCGPLCHRIIMNQLRVNRSHVHMHVHLHIVMQIGTYGITHKHTHSKKIIYNLNETHTLFLYIIWDLATFELVKQLT